MTSVSKTFLNAPDGPITVSKDIRSTLSTPKHGRFAEYAVVEFTEKFFDAGMITPKCRKEIKEFFKNDLKGFNREKKVTDEELFKTILSLTKTIYRKKKEAEKVGKPLLIVLGENHTSREALVLEYMAIAIACDLGFHTALMEFDDKSLPIFVRAAECLKCHTTNLHYQISSSNTVFSFLFFMANRMNIIPVDPHFSEASETWEKISKFKSTGDPKADEQEKERLQKLWDKIVCSPMRQQSINNEIQKINSDAIGVFGRFHLQHIMKCSMEDKFYILYLHLGEFGCDVCSDIILHKSIETKGTPYRFNFVELQQKIINLQRVVRLYLSAAGVNIYPETPSITAH